MALDRDSVGLHVTECVVCREAVSAAREAQALATTLPPSGGHSLPDEEHAASGTDVPVRTGEYAPPAARYTRDGAELGRGGLGRVVLGQDRVLRREVAVKELTFAADDPAVRQRFEREARLAAQLEHPAIITVYDLGRTGDEIPFYVMRRVEGRTLSDAIAHAGTREARQALLAHVLPLCHAVAYAHSRGVLHRDIKPQNVMVGRFGETVLLDWGLARRDASPASLPDVGETGAGSLVGTPAYMSPEQARGDVKALDERTDVYGLGAVLFQVLTGRPPHEGASVAELVHQVRAEPVRAVRQVEPDAPPELAAVAQKCLAFDPAQRYASAAEVAADVERYLTGGRVSAYRYPRLELLGRFARRHRAVLSVAAAALVALGAVLAVSYRSVQRERDELRGFTATLLVELAEKVEAVPGMRPLLDALTAQALEVSQRLASSTAATDRDRRLLAQAWMRIGGIEDSAGRYAESERAFGLALAHADPLVDTGERRAVLPIAVMARTLLGEHSSYRNNLTRARGLLAEIERLVPLALEEHRREPGADMCKVLAYAAYARASMLGRTQDYGAALAAMDEAVAWDERGLALKTPTDRERYNLQVDMMEAGLYAVGARRFDEAGRRFATALKVARDNEARTPGSIDAVYGLAAALKTTAHWHQRHGRAEEAGALLEEAVGKIDWLLQNDPAVSINVELALQIHAARGDLTAIRGLLGRLSKNERVDAADDVSGALLLVGRLDEVVALWKELEEPSATVQLMAVLALAQLGRNAEALDVSRALVGADGFGDFGWGYRQLRLPPGTPAAALVEALDVHETTADRAALRIAFERFQAELAQQR